MESHMPANQTPDHLDTAQLLLEEWVAGLPLDVANALTRRLSAAFRAGGEEMRRVILADLRKQIERDEYDVKTARDSEDRAICRVLLEQHQHTFRDVASLPPLGDAP
jgi:hypothetical protein